MRRCVRIDKDKLDALAGVRFTWSDISELVELAADYAGRFAEPLPDYLLAYGWEHQVRPRRLEMEARRAFIDAVEAVWRERRRRSGLGAHYDIDAELHGGPLVQLLQYLFGAIDELAPSPATLFHDLRFLATRRERSRGPTHTRKRQQV